MNDESPIPAARPPILTIRSLSKSFGGVRALNGVNLTIRPGEVHGLLGENGSGKSTLIKILAGYHAPDEGELEVRGQRVRLPLRPGEFRSLGLDFVHQDLALIRGLSVLENLRVGELAVPRRRWYISWAQERRRAAETFARYGIDLDPRARVGDLLPVERAMVAIVRALEGVHAGGTRQGALLLLDEPTVFLPQAGIDQLFALLRKIVATGMSVLFVSHDLDEVRQVTDRVTVLRDGRVVGTVATRETTETRLVEMIIGRELPPLQAAHGDLRSREVQVAVESLSTGVLDGISLGLYEGEVLGLTGLAGSGFEDIPYVLFGAAGATSGRLALSGRVYELSTMSPDAALRAGIGLIPADRQRDGSIGSLRVVENMMLQVLDQYFDHFILRRTQMVRGSAEAMTTFDVRPNDPQITYSSLSGGNQQKALLAKWLQTKPALLLLHEPTQGVDVGARQQIFSLIREAASAGTCVICASSDHEQLAAISDRVLIFGRGRVVRSLVGKEVSKDRISEQTLNSVALLENLTLTSG